MIGLSLGIAILESKPKNKVCIFEKEKEVSTHASGRNSGVIHAGFYYTPESLKAKFCRDGNIFLRKFCTENDIPIHSDNWYSYTKLLADAYIELRSKNYLICRETHKPKPFPYESAWVDQIGNFDYIDKISGRKIILTRPDRAPPGRRARGRRPLPARPPTSNPPDRASARPPSRGRAAHIKRGRSRTRTANCSPESRPLSRV